MILTLSGPQAGKEAFSVSQNLFDIFPRLEKRLGCAPLGHFPTPVEPLSYRGSAKIKTSELWVKREDLSSDIYGGNKIRTLEWLFAQAAHAGCGEICSTGAYGSNHAVATVLHAPRFGLRSSVMLNPQPYSETARKNLEVVLSHADEIMAIPHWSYLPAGILRKRLRDKAQNRSTWIMHPGGATPAGALGYVSAALELAGQVMSGEMPLPQRIVLPVGSTCTTAGLLLGTEIASRLGFGGKWSAPPELIAVRVTPWPLTARRRIAFLSFRASRLLHRLTGDDRVLVPYVQLLERLQVDATQLGEGYGYPTPSGWHAMDQFPHLLMDTTYSAKAAAALIQIAQNTSGCTLFWATKSSCPLPAPDDSRIAKAPPAMMRWLEDGAAADR